MGSGIYIIEWRCQVRAFFLVDHGGFLPQITPIRPILLKEECP